MTQLLLVVLGFAFLFSVDALTQGVSIGTHPSWHQIAFALPLAMLAYTGLETVANLAEETREPGRDLPRSLFSGIGLVVLIYVAIALRRAERVPGHERHHRARHRLARLAADGDRRRASRPAARTAWRRRCASTSA